LVNLWYYKSAKYLFSPFESGFACRNPVVCKSGDLTDMKRFRLIDVITGWAVFAVAAVTYLMTIEPTTSLWDCGEFIASAFKLEVGHPPGAPVFMILGRFFSMFAGGDVTRVAAMVNAMSALASAFTILFLYWSVTHIARKIMLKTEEQFSVPNIIAVIASGVVGALAYTFSDTFWFSAVESEVYATSSLFTALVFWAILKWEDSSDERHGDRWLILIAYLMGLSLGVHLLNLLVLPAIVFIYYFRKFTFSWKGFGFSTAISLMILVLIMYGIIPGVLLVSSKFELFFINTLGLPYQTGVIIHVLFLAATIILAVRYTVVKSDTVKLTVVASLAIFLTGMWALTESVVINILILAVAVYLIWQTAEKSRAILNTILTSVLVILIGYSSFAIILIRSSANPPMDENNPENIFSLIYYLNREQYGQRPLVTGHYYNAPVLSYESTGKPTYNPADGKYIVTKREFKRVYDERFNTIFPRMWSDSPDHISVYKEWGRVKGVPVAITDPSTGERRTERKPTFVENIRFMVSYQVNFMYLRYFMWNFSGRQNDVQSYGGAVNGNWITGIEKLDNLILGTRGPITEEMKNDPSRNRYFMLPLLLGLAGFFYMVNKDVRNWWVVFLLFIMTGLAIVIYLNQYPNQPRERDYAYAGSFYAWSMWIGIGVLFLYEAFSTFLSKKFAAPLAALLSVIAVPVLMAAENFDDHDRSGRYLGRDVAVNYLNSCAPGAILFTNGDNDTFPLWYVQETEGVRTDVRVSNLMLLNTDWYIEQMKMKAYESEPLPLSLPVGKYYDGINNQVFIIERVKDTIDIRQVIDFVKSESEVSKYAFSATDKVDFIPARTIRIPVNKEKVLASGTVKPEDADMIVPFIDITLKGNSIMKSQMMVLDILAQNDWQRPVYFVSGYHNDAMGLEEYFQLEGLAFRLVPVKSHNRNWLDYGRVDSEILYENMINKFQWRGANDPDVYLDYYHKRTLTVIRARYNYARLASTLVQEGDTARALGVLDFCIGQLPFSSLPHDIFSSDIIAAYFAAGSIEKATAIASEATDFFFERAAYWIGQSPEIVYSAEYEIQSALQYASRIGTLLGGNGVDELAVRVNKRVEELYSEFLFKRERTAG
jgi:hypothetical protein